MIIKYKYSLVLSLVILYLSLKNSSDFNTVQFFQIPYFDKFVHFCMYFALMSVIIYETVKSSVSRSLYLIALYPFFYGVLMEVLQGAVTTTRSSSIYDAMFNTVGIIASMLVWLTIRKIRNAGIK